MQETAPDSPWYYLLDSQAYGPLTLGELAGLVASGQIGPETLVRHGDTDWVPAASVPQLGLLSTPAAVSAQTLSYPAPGLHNPQISNLVVQLMGQTSLWVRIMSTLMFIGIGLMFIGSIIVGGVAAMGRGGRDTASAAFVALIYFVMAIIYVIPSLFLSRYASHSKAFGRQRELTSLEQALQAQKSFWKFVAIFSLVIIGIYLLMIAIFLLAVVMRRGI